MKYISLQDLIDHGKELRFQSADQMAKVYEQLPGIEIVHCKDCSYSQSATIDVINEYELEAMWCGFNDCYVHENDFCSGGNNDTPVKN